MNKLMCLLLAPVGLFAQDAAVNFTTTTNASQFGVSFVVGFEFTVSAPITVTALGALLRDAPLNPVFGELPTSMQVGLWDNEQELLLVSATVVETDPLTGHFNYAPVKATALTPGVHYTVAGLVAAGQSVLSDVPDLATGPGVTYAGTKTLVSNALALPSNDVLAQRQNYFGPTFNYTIGQQYRRPPYSAPAPKPRTHR
jgi:hypothetical protein